MLLSNVQAEFVDLLLSQENSHELFTPNNKIAYFKARYQNQLRDQLLAIYPMITHFTGETIMHELIKQYIDNFPCRHELLKQYGEFFYDVIQNVFRAKAYLSDIANFEWACHQVKHAPEHSGVDAATMSKEKQLARTTSFILHPAVKLISFNCDVLQIRDIYLAKEPLPEIINQSARYLFIFRDGFTLTFHQLKQSQWVFLKALDSQKSINEANEEALSIDRHFTLPDFSSMIAQKVFVEILKA